MTKLIDRFAEYCLTNDLISEKDLPWLKYKLEKRISSILGGLPFFAIAVLLSGLHEALAFYVSFYYLRSRTSGFHASSVLICMVFSVALEMVFLGLIAPSINAFTSMLIAISGTILIFWLAPYNHPNMNFTKNELMACRMSSRIRSGGLLLVAFSLYCFECEKLLKGVTIGIAMAAFLLCLAYILNGGKNNEKHTREA